MLVTAAVKITMETLGKHDGFKIFAYVREKITGGEREE